MRAKWQFLLGVILAAPLAAQTGSDAFLVKADSIVAQPDHTVVATGRAAVMTKTGIRFTAERVVFEESSGTLKLSGDVVIHPVKGDSISVKELTLAAKGKRLFTLVAGEVHLSGASMPVMPVSDAFEFVREFPKTEMDLVTRRSRNSSCLRQ